MADGDELFGQLTRILQRMEWIEMVKTLEKLKLWSKNLENRKNLTDARVLNLKNMIAVSQGFLQETMAMLEEKHVTCLRCVTEAFRVLRNCCAEVPENQCKVVTAGLVGTVRELLILLLKPHFQEDDHAQETVNRAVQSGIQLIGNAVVGNITTQEVIWKELFPSFFRVVLSSGDQASQDCTCMVIYNSFNPQKKLELVTCQEGHRIISSILHLCVSQAQLEWGYFIVESIISSGLLPEAYSGLEFDPSSRIILLDIIQVRLCGSTKESTERESSTKQQVPEESLLYLATEFEKATGEVMFQKDHDFQAENTMQALVVSRLLHVLCAATSLHEQFPSLQSKVSLTEKAIGLLHQTNTPENLETFSNVSKVPVAPDSGELSPSHGFKRDLVRLIGNMCYQSRQNQDQVRHLDGIPLLLDHCNVDDHNPYITQWAIFAIRNLLQNNLENQTVVSALNAQGFGDTSRLQQFGVNVVQQENGHIKVVPL